MARRPPLHLPGYRAILELFRYHKDAHMGKTLLGALGHLQGFWTRCAGHPSQFFQIGPQGGVRYIGIAPGGRVISFGYKGGEIAA